MPRTARPPSSDLIWLMLTMTGVPRASFWREANAWSQNHLVYAMDVISPMGVMEEVPAGWAGVLSAEIRLWHRPLKQSTVV